MQKNRLNPHNVTITSSEDLCMYIEEHPAALFMEDEMEQYKSFWCQEMLHRFNLKRETFVNRVTNDLLHDYIRAIYEGIQEDSKKQGNPLMVGPDMSWDDQPFAVTSDMTLEQFKDKFAFPDDSYHVRALLEVTTHIDGVLKHYKETLKKEQEQEPKQA